MARRPRDVTDAELDVLRALWGDGPATIRTLADGLYPSGGTSEYATVQKLLERLEGKGHVTRRAEGRQNVYSATVQREELVARRLRENGISVIAPVSERPMGAQLKRATRSGARFALFVGREELAGGRFGLKDLESGLQEQLEERAVIARLRGEATGGIDEC